MLELRYYQSDAVNAFFEYTANNWTKHPLVIIPTGGGKSLVIAYIIRHMLEYENTRILLLTHQQELIKQNFLELIENFNNEIFLDIGIYSAGLDCRDTQNRILFAGIQSVYNKAWELGFFNLILVDESHLIPSKGEGMYRTFFKESLKINPKIIIGGLTATGYRMKDGLLTEGEGHLFDDICHETTVRELIDPHHYKNKDKQQYLCKLISKGAVNKVDLSNVHIQRGEYRLDEMQEAFEADDLVSRAVKEIIEYTTDRKKILIFTSGIRHCEDIVDKFKEFGITDIGFVHSKQKQSLNDEYIQQFKNGIIKYLINVNTLTVGFNEKAIDCIVLLRSTMSPGLYYQMCGRGFRMHPDKKDCLVLDFGQNIVTHGPVDKIIIKKKKNGKPSEIETMPSKECPKCQAILPIQTRTCPDCGYEFPSNPNHEEEASTASILSEWKKPEPMDVYRIEYSRHEKKDKPDSMRVDYYWNAYLKYSEWICVEHSGYAKRKANKWMQQRLNPYIQIDSVTEALDLSHKFKKPIQIIVDENSKYPTITGYIFNDEESELRFGNTIQEEEELTPQAKNILERSKIDWDKEEIPF